MRCLRILLFTSIFMLTACASTANFKTPVTQLATATDAAAATVQSLDKKATQRYNELAFESALKETAHIKALPDTGRPNSPGCETTSLECILALYKTPHDKAPRALNAPSLMSNSVRILAGIQNYVKALNTIVNADASGDVKDGMHNALLAAAAIATTVGSPIGPIIKALDQPVTESAVWIFKQYQDRRKLEALQKATQAADPVISKAMDVIGQQIWQSNNSALAHLERQYSNEVSSLEQAKKPTATQLKSLLNAASDLNAALHLKTSDMFSNLATAHHKLTEALKSPKPSYADVLVLSQNVLTMAGDIQKMIDAVTTSAQSGKN